MNNKEKMLAGESYNAQDPLLCKERMYAKDCVYEYNHLRPSDVSSRFDILKKLLYDVNNDIYIEPPFYCDYGYNIKVGKQFYANHNFVILDGAPVTIGDRVYIAPNVSLFAATHPIDAIQRSSDIEYAHPITIGNDVWIGGNTVINPGINIGDDVVIGSGSVVTKDIPSHVVAAGNPCRILRYITKEDKKK